MTDATNHRTPGLLGKVNTQINEMIFTAQSAADNRGSSEELEFDENG